MPLPLRTQVDQGKTLVIACVYAATLMVAYVEARPENEADASLGVD
ncbi:hypothetical protein PPSAL_2666 [Ectopseudomonas oleovorans]|uniref:Uncharacterized protein n=1 Tax=Ectopseudomonas oleovorans (strain CECT 5344) TaxID=1182590 RepID=W6QWP2_ECTO5|nr:hypothetical protein BN5_2701 [Pseudomonas oleovorans CECT 5344]CDR91893.1 hypothetical protein PPSAL_2666 [Pseudomonas oleovorans]